MKLNFIKNLGLLTLVIVLSLIFSYPLGEKFYLSLNIPQGMSSFIISNSANYHITGFVLAYLLFISLIFTAFGDKTRYWWIGVLLIPAAAFEIYFDLGHIYIPLIIGLIGWLIGLAVSRVLLRIR